MSALSVLTVGEVTRDLREIIESAYSDIVIEGELSNFKRASSGHCYFTLKDEKAQLRSVMWRASTGQLRFRPENGMLVRATGYLSLYEPRGDVQLIAHSLSLAGKGALQQAFEALKRQLSSEGLFDSEHKIPLPTYPEHIGIITSGTGAALQDILSILQRRYPHVNVYVCPVRVQGHGAAEMIAEAIDAFNDAVQDGDLNIDSLIVGRGGGSAEDLWAFNEEVVARSIAASRIPIISAVGHETDVSISDFVADLRAATPSMAAELAVPDRKELLHALSSTQLLLSEAIRRNILLKRQRVEYLSHCYAFNSPIDSLRRFQQRSDHAIARIKRTLPTSIPRLKNKLDQLHHQLQRAHPEQPFQRGFTRLEVDGRPILSTHDAPAGTNVDIYFKDGKRRARIVE